MAILRKNGATSNLLRLVLFNSATGLPLTGLTSASAGLIISTLADNEAAATVYLQSGSTIETIATLGTFAVPTATKCRFREVDAVNHPGLYEFQFSDARYAVANARELVLSVSGAANLQTAHYQVQLVSVDLYDVMRLGLTALPNANAEAVGGLYTRGTNAGQINQDTNGRIDARAAAVSADAITAASIAVDALDASALATDAVNEIADGILDRTVTEPVSIWAWPVTLRKLLGWLGALTRNKKAQDHDGPQRVYADDGTTVIATSAVTDASGVTTTGEFV